MACPAALHGLSLAYVSCKDTPSWAPNRAAADAASDLDYVGPGGKAALLAVSMRRIALPMVVGIAGML